MVKSRQFRDRHLFSLLCWRNFAHLPEMTFIESVQRVTSYGHRKGHLEVIRGHSLQGLANASFDVGDDAI